MTGAVVGFSGDRVRVRPADHGACFGCLKGECAAGRLVTAENPGGLPLAPGQRVEIRSPLPALLGQAIAGLLPPILGFAGIYGLAGLWGPGEAGRAAAGVLGLFAGGFAVCLLRRRFPARALPRIRRILTG